MKMDDEFDRLFRIDGRAPLIRAVGNLERRSAVQSLMRTVPLEPTFVQRQLPLHRIECHRPGYEVHLSSAKLVHLVADRVGAQFGQAGPPQFG